MLCMFWTLLLRGKTKFTIFLVLDYWCRHEVPVCIANWVCDSQIFKCFPKAHFCSSAWRSGHWLPPFQWWHVFHLRVICPFFTTQNVAFCSAIALLRKTGLNTQFCFIHIILRGIFKANLTFPPFSWKGEKP